MADKARQQTDKRLAEMEKYLTSIYRESAKGIYEKWNEFMSEANDKLSKLQKEYDDAKVIGDKALIKKTGIKLSRAKKNVTLYNDYYKSMLDETTRQLANVNKTAIAYINGQMPDIYTINYNAVAPDALSIGARFDIRDAHTVRRLILDGEIELPHKSLDVSKDMMWNKKQINNSVLQGILQGESIDKISRRIFKQAMAGENLQGLEMGEVVDIIDKNRNSAIRTARTMVTSAENHGRLDSYMELAEQGVIEKKVWVATPDDRTRPSHIDMDGEEQDINTRFSNGCMFPGDGSGPPEEVWMCRCTMVTNIIGIRGKGGKINYLKRVEKGQTMHERQMQEEKQRRKDNANV